MKVSEACKRAGLKSLAELSIITGKNTCTLRRWHEGSPEFFRVVLVGAVAVKASGKAVASHDR